jgi:hypothetical protein
MKKLIYITSIIFMSACSQNSETKPTTSFAISEGQIAVYDFHTTHRCETCLAIEDATKEVLNTNFKSQFDDKTITFTLINADAKENQAIAEEYNAFGTTLAITIVKDNKKEILDITNWAFDAIHGDDFNLELTEKLNKALAKL